MNAIIENIQSSILETSTIEWLAVLCGTLYVILITHKKMIAWLFAFLSSSIYVYICYSFQLYLESFLQVFYVAMAIIGWLNWTKSESKTNIIKWPIKHHIYNILASSAITLLLGYVFQKNTDQANPYTDAFTTVFSLAATYMVTKKVLENWIYWIIIDFVSIYLFYSRGLHLTALLFVVFTSLAIWGYLKWKKEYEATT